MKLAIALAPLLVAGTMCSSCVGSRSQRWFEEGRAAEARGDWDEAVEKHRRAVAESPENVAYRIALVLAEEEARRRTSGAPFVPATLQPEPAPADPLAETPVNLKFEDASLAEIFRALSQLAGVNILFDEAYRDVRVSVDLRGLSLRSALELLAETHGLFLKIED